MGSGALPMHHSPTLAIPSSPSAHRDAPVGRRPGVSTVRAVGVVLVAAALTTYFYNIAVRSYPGDSDAATIVLQAQSFDSGNVLLSGWRALYDSFWTVEVPLYAIGVALVGVKSQLLFVVPATVAAATTMIAALLARQDLPTGNGASARRAPGVAAVLTVATILALPTGAWTYLFLRGGWHVATVLWCLVAFAALRRPGSRLGWLVAVVFLAAGLLGDLQTLLLGVLPVFGAGLLTMVRGRSWRQGLPAVTAAVAAGVVAIGARRLAQAIGTFDIGSANARAGHAQMLRNLGHLPRFLVETFGIGQTNLGPGAGPTAFTLVRVAGLGLVTVAVGVAIMTAVVGAIRGARGSEQSTWNPDDLLAAAVLGDLALFVVITPSSSEAYVRYLTPTVIFGSILAARFAARMIALANRAVARRIGIVGLALVALSAVDVVPASARPMSTPAVTALADFLLAHGLRQGIGAYWTASILTVASDDAVRVRPVIGDPAGRIVRYGKQSTSAWYAGKTFQFLVWDTAAPSFNVSETTASLTFGKVAHRLSFRTYRIMVWDHPITVAPSRYAG